MATVINPHKIVVFTGAGISAESGIKTFRDKDGLWVDRNPMKIASVQAWLESPEDVIDFHNLRLIEVEKAQPNLAHLAVKELEAHFEVVVITQNVDDLHEKAGSTEVIHLHGMVTEVYPDGEPSRVSKRGYEPLSVGETDDYGRQLRPNIVLFGEEVYRHEEALNHIREAGRVLVVGTSLSVEPAAGMLKKSRFKADRVIVSHQINKKPYGFDFLKGNATSLVPFLVKKWISQGDRVL